MSHKEQEGKVMILVFEDLLKKLLAKADRLIGVGQKMNEVLKEGGTIESKIHIELQEESDIQGLNRFKQLYREALVALQAGDKTKMVELYHLAKSVVDDFFVDDVNAKIQAVEPIFSFLDNNDIQGWKAKMDEFGLLKIEA